MTHYLLDPDEAMQEFLSDLSAEVKKNLYLAIADGDLLETGRILYQATHEQVREIENERETAMQAGPDEELLLDNRDRARDMNKVLKWCV